MATDYRYSQVCCSSCKTTRCRLCDRPSHPGEPCLEDQREPGNSRQMSAVGEVRAAAAAEN
jgi:hypothetical protein